MEKNVLVYVDLREAPQLVGRLWARVGKNRESATFEYDEAWLAHASRFSLEPALKLGPGPFHTPSDKPLFGAIGDSAPDRWGRVLMRRAERRRAERAGGTPRTLWEIDYLLMVADEARPGALRFAEREGGPFLAQPVDRAQTTEQGMEWVSRLNTLVPPLGLLTCPSARTGAREVSRL